MKISFATISESAIIDQQSNQLSIINIIERIEFFGPLPFQFPKITLVMNGERNINSNISKSETLSIKVSKISPSGVSENINEFKLTIEEGKERTRAIISLMGIQFSEIGVYQFLIESVHEKSTKSEQIVYVSVLGTQKNK